MYTYTTQHKSHLAGELLNSVIISLNIWLKRFAKVPAKLTSFKSKTTELQNASVKHLTC